MERDCAWDHAGHKGVNRNETKERYEKIKSRLRDICNPARGLDRCLNALDTVYDGGTGASP